MLARYAMSCYVAELIVVTAAYTLSIRDDIAMMMPTLPIC